MSTSAECEPLPRRFNGWTDVRLPIGMWSCRQALTGNATGGDMIISIVFASAALNNLNANLYNLEQVGLVATNNVLAYGSVCTINMDDFGNLTGSDNVRSFTMLPTQLAAHGSAIDVKDAAALGGMFLGRQLLLGQRARVEVGTPNINTSLMTLTAQGYMWSPRSVLAEGGPARPPMSLYR